MAFYAIEDAQADPCWVKVVSPFENTQVASEAKEYTVLATANADCTTLNASNPGRFHVGTSPKPH